MNEWPSFLFPMVLIVTAQVQVDHLKAGHCNSRFSLLNRPDASSSFRARIKPFGSCWELLMLRIQFVLLGPHIPNIFGPFHSPPQKLLIASQIKWELCVSKDFLWWAFSSGCFISNSFTWTLCSSPFNFPVVPTSDLSVLLPGPFAHAHPQAVPHPCTALRTDLPWPWRGPHFLEERRLESRHHYQLTGDQDSQRASCFLYVTIVRLYLHVQVFKCTSKCSHGAGHSVPRKSYRIGCTWTLASNKWTGPSLPAGGVLLTAQSETCVLLCKTGWELPPGVAEDEMSAVGPGRGRGGWTVSPLHSLLQEEEKPALEVICFTKN